MLYLGTFRQDLPLNFKSGGAFVVLAYILLCSVVIHVMDVSVSSLHEERAYKHSDICTTGRYMQT